MLKVLLSDVKLFSILILISALLIFTDHLSLLNQPKGFIQQVTIPIQYGLYKTSRLVINQFEFIILARKASQENKALTEQLALVLSENANLRRKLAETEGFVEQQKSLSPQEFNLVAARPIGQSRYLVIDKGIDDGIKVGQAVVYKDNFLGRVKEVSPKKANVIMSTDPDSRVSGFVTNNDGKAKGVIKGEFGSEMLLDKVLHQEPLNKNDLVYSEGTELDIPRGLIIGRISQVFNRDNEVFKQAKVLPVFTVGDLDIVFVVTN